MALQQIASQNDDRLAPLPLLAGTVDRITRAAALGISRRRFIHGAVAATAAVGLGSLLEPLPVSASFCNACFGPCANYQSCTGYCCSPSGQYCWASCCTCTQGSCRCTVCDGRGNCGHYFSAEIQVCDDGSHTYGCSQSCWGLTC